MSVQPGHPVTLFPTCLVDIVEADVGLATAGVLAGLGCEVQVPDSVTCCGQPAWNAGHAKEAAEVARTTLSALAEGDGDIVVPSGSCTTMIRVFWRELFELEGSDVETEQAEAVGARTFEFSEYVERLGAPSGRIPAQPAIVYHRSCHMQRELGITDAPEKLLDDYGADRRETASAGRCCGFGGLFSVKLPETSVAMADEVLDDLVRSGATLVVGCDASCLMHLRGRSDRRQLGLEFGHLAEVIAEASDQ